MIGIDFKVRLGLGTWGLLQGFKKIDDEEERKGKERQEYLNLAP